jgi:Uma2 family endonuclease
MSLAAVGSEVELVPHLVTPEEYLAAELLATHKHEYVGGVVYAMAGGRIRHHLIASNIGGMLYSRLRGKECKYFNSDTKVRCRLPTHTRFYYPDAQVTCRMGQMDDMFQDEPVIIVEVLSKSTRRTDEHEKKDGYLTIGALNAYLLVEQESAFVTVWRRTSSGFVREQWKGLAAAIPLPEIEASLPLAEIYESVEFGPEESDDDEVFS